MVFHYYLSIRSIGVLCRLEINGALQFSDTTGLGGSVTKAINYWLMPSANHLSLSLKPATRSLANPGPVAKVELSYFEADPDQEYPTPLRILHQFTWEEESGPSLPYLHETPIPCDPAPPTRVWGEATPLQTLEASDKQALIDLANSLCDHIMAGRSEEAYGLVSYRYQEEALADGKDEALNHKIVVEQYTWLHGLKGLSAQKPSEATTQFRILAAQKLVVLESPDGRPGLIFKSDEPMTVGIQLYAAKIKGEWHLVR